MIIGQESVCNVHNIKWPSLYTVPKTVPISRPHTVAVVPRCLDLADARQKHRRGVPRVADVLGDDDLRRPERDTMLRKTRSRRSATSGTEEFTTLAHAQSGYLDIK